MSQNTDRRLNSSLIEEETQALNGLRGLPDYSPVREEARVSSAEAAQGEMLAARALEANLKAQLQDAIAASRLAEWKFHNCMLAAKDAVIAQYGRKSTQARSIGHKPRTNVRRKKNVDPNPKGE